MLSDSVLAPAGSYFGVGLLFGIGLHIFAVQSGGYIKYPIHPIRLVLTCTMVWPLILLLTVLRQSKRNG